MPRIKLSSSSSMFAARGNPWVTQREADKDFPLNRTLYPEGEKEDFHTSILKANLKRKNDELRRRMGLATGDLAKPRLSKYVCDPDLDQYTKASKALPKREAPSEKAKKVKDSGRAAALRNAANRNMKVVKR